MLTWGLLLLLSLADKDLHDHIHGHYKKALGGDVEVEPLLEELKKARRLFALIFSGDRSEEVQALAAGLDFELKSLKTGIWVLTETRKRGRGFYLFAENESKLAVQAPHGFHDRHTADIGLKLFLEGGLGAGAWNTISRKTEMTDGAPADMAHLKESWFQAFTTAWVNNGGKILQLHGYAKKKRKTREGRTADLIFSSGRKKPSRTTIMRYQCLSKNFDMNIRLYGNNVFELGGLTNSQRRIIASESDFHHVEMSLGLRKKLLKDQEARRLFLSCWR